MNPAVDPFFARATAWQPELARLRALLLDFGFDEVLKWGKPTYAHGGENIALLQPMKGFLALLFFKGALLDDPAGHLEPPGENSHAARRACFTAVEQIDALEPTLRRFFTDAIALAEAGEKVQRPTEHALIAELQARLDADPALKAAFEALTPGRQRAYNLHFGGAKQAKTRISRIESLIPKILAGKGFRDE